ncbi:ECF transporter S component [Oscillospiraceae bacterium OttesenSCG-928-F05]|nr:ECF transporter S component [Oscillospiraceae bacterium OttesenSCG-928-F05]
MATEKRTVLYSLVSVGFMAALTFVGSMIQIPIPTPIDNTRIHLGNVFCLLGGLLLGPLYGGLSAGIGSMFFDLTNPLYIASAPFTFAFKFLMAALCGLVAKGRGKVFKIVGAACGAFAYVLLYLAKSFLENVFVLQVELPVVFASVSVKAVTSSINGVLAVIIAVPLYYALSAALRQTEFFMHLPGRER